jgi:uncharacterized repeat protein (TIGR01451 family)
MSILLKNLARCFAVAAVVLCAVVFPTAVLAVGTDADTDIDNIALVDYEVASIPQSQVSSGTYTFKVDQVVDVTVSEVNGSQTLVLPNETDAVTRFFVTNTGNEVQDFDLIVNNIATVVFGVTDNFDPSSITIVVDANDDDTYDGGDTVIDYIDELSADPTSNNNRIAVFVLADIPIGQVAGDGANIELVVLAHEGGTASSQGGVQAEDAGPNTDGLEVVFDNETDSDESSYEVDVTPSLGATKDSEVLDDPTGGTFPNAFAIPGATVEYTVTITNTGTVAADNVEVSDTLQSDLTLLVDVYNGAADNVEITIGAGPATYCDAEVGGTDTNTDGCVLVGALLTVAPPGITADAVANAPDNVITVSFQVSIN